MSKRVHYHLALARKFNVYGLYRLERYVYRRLQRVGVYISPNAIVPDSVVFPHPIGIVIGDGVKLGKNVRIFQNVTLGGARVGDASKGNYPEIGDNVVIFSGAVVIGRIHIGDNAIIGANSVITKDVPSNSTCVGVPGKLI